MSAYIIKYILTNKYVVVFVLVSASIFLFFTYYLYASNKIKRIESENIKLQQTLQQKDEYIQTLREDYDKIIKSRDELNQLVSNSTKSIDELKSRLNRQESKKKTISDLAKRKPKLVQNAINSAIKKQIECFKNMKKVDC